MLNKAVINIDVINIDIINAEYALKQPHRAGSTAVSSSLVSSLYTYNLYQDIPNSRISLDRF